MRTGDVVGEKERTMSNKMICGGERRCGERANEIYGRSMDQQTKELKESCKCNTLSLKRINVSCDKMTIISYSQCSYVANLSDFNYFGSTSAVIC